MSEPLVSLKEHEPLPSGCNPKQWNDTYYKNPLLTWSSFGSKEDLPQFQWQTYYRIGAQWLDEKREQALVVTPKIKNIDFTKMFLCCLESGLAVKDFSKIYDINFEQPAIQTDAFDNVLTPLIIIHFLTVVEGIAKRGLKRGYVHREENLKKVKGRIRILANERKNIIPRRFDRVYCQYNEFTVDIPENRLIKKALLFAQKELARFSGFKHYSSLFLLENKCLAAFSQVSPEIELRDVKLIKSHKLFREYDLAVKLAKTILRRNDYSIKKASEDEKSTPVFWLNMALLFEHYVYSILHEQYGEKIIYQFKGNESETPDFLYKNVYKNEIIRGILDTKYIDLDGNCSMYKIVRQLAGYARDVKVLRKLDYKVEEMGHIVVPCIFLYPKTNVSNDDTNNNILDRGKWISIDNWIKFYKIGVALPREKQGG